jgi:hypothetical protein
VVKQE